MVGALTSRFGAKYDPAIMLEPVPERIWPCRMAREGESLTGWVPVASMPRLRAVLARDDGGATVELHFAADDVGRGRVDGRIAAALSLTCQRCLRPLTMDVSTEIHLALVESDAQAAKVPEPYEPFLVTQEPVSTHTLVEDELLLTLPIVAVHEDDTCRAPVEAGSDSAVGETEHPFAALKEFGKRD